MGAPSVSIIMNIRDGAAYLREALDSVMAQTFTDWEAIVWDDCSVDESPTIVQEEYTDPRIRYMLSPEDTRLGRARHLAIQHAQGEWLAFLDQDDIWLPDKLQKQVARIEDDPKVGIVYGRTLAFSATGLERDYDHRHEFEPLPEGDIFTSLLTDSCFIAMSSAMLRRAAVNEAGGVPDAIHVSPDYFLYLAAASRYQGRAVQDVICRYRLHGGNMSNTTGRAIQTEALWVLDQWADRIDPPLLRWRRKVHNTVLAVQEMRQLSTAGRGVVRLLTHGSAGYLASRPFARAFREIRRWVRRPYWQGTSSADESR